jgi:sulfate transport system ATP-binding protein
MVWAMVCSLAGKPRPPRPRDRRPLRRRADLKRSSSKAEVDKRVKELLALIQLEGHGRRLPSQLSGGQRQRVALAAMPRVLLLDEPFGALDAQVRAELRGWLRRLHDEIHLTTVFVTHDQDEAFEVADQVVVTNKGRIEQLGSPAEVFESPANDFVMRFWGTSTSSTLSCRRAAPRSAL